MGIWKISAGLGALPEFASVGPGSIPGPRRLVSWSLLPQESLQKHQDPLSHSRRTPLCVPSIRLTYAATQAACLADARLPHPRPHPPSLGSVSAGPARPVSSQSRPVHLIPSDALLLEPMSFINVFNRNKYPIFCSFPNISTWRGNNAFSNGRISGTFEVDWEPSISQRSWPTAKRGQHPRVYKSPII